MVGMSAARSRAWVPSMEDVWRSAKDAVAVKKISGSLRGRPSSLAGKGRMSMADQGFTSTQRWVLGLAAAGSFMAVLDAMVVTTALDNLRHDLGASMEALEW